MSFTAREVLYTRILEYKQFVFGQQPKTVISREYPAKWKLGIEMYYQVNDEKNQLCYAACREFAQTG